MITVHFSRLSAGRKHKARSITGTTTGGLVTLRISCEAPGSGYLLKGIIEKMGRICVLLPALVHHRIKMVTGATMIGVVTRVRLGFTEVVRVPENTWKECKSIDLVIVGPSLPEGLIYLIPESFKPFHIQKQLQPTPMATIFPEPFLAAYYRRIAWTRADDQTQLKLICKPKLALSTLSP